MCPAWSAVAAEHEQLGRDALKAGRTISAGEHLSQAAVYFTTREAFRVRSKSADMETARRRSAELTMAGRAELITRPLLAVMGKLDRLIPWQHAQRLVDEASGFAQLLLEKGNHGCANLAPFHRGLGR